MLSFQPYGRNWSFLWAVPIPKWQILLLVIGFFIGVWALMMGVLTWFSKTHTWLLPVFAVGLGAPRWCQMLWGTSSLALYIPWAGHAGPYLGISLWLWLGVLDAVQGVGLGMILLQVRTLVSLRCPVLTVSFRRSLVCTCALPWHSHRSLDLSVSWSPERQHPTKLDLKASSQMLRSGTSRMVSRVSLTILAIDTGSLR